MDWLNEAPYWVEQGDTVTMRSAPKTDFWRVTFSSVVVDSCLKQDFAAASLRSPFHYQGTLLAELLNYAGLCDSTLVLFCEYLE